MDAVFIFSAEPTMAHATHVLIVDDNADTRDGLRKLLEGAGHAVTCVVNGEDALRCLSEEARPDLILLDLWMPHMDGWKFRQRLWQNPVLAGIPVVLVSAECDLGQIADALDVNAYVRKPVDPEVLLQTVSALGASGECSYFTE
jgi:CheY-like chemotaxis protein